MVLVELLVWLKRLFQLLWEKIELKTICDSSAQIITGADMSCLMHMDGIINRDKNPIKVMHIVEILLGAKA